MKSLAAWLLAVATSTLAGALLGRALGEVLFQINLDEVVAPAAYGIEGMRYGLLAGTWLGACAVVGRRSVPPIGRVGFALGVAVAVALGSAIGAAAGAYVLARAGWLTIPGSMKGLVGHPYRLLFCYGLQAGAMAGGAAGALAGGALLWLSRGRPSPAPLREGAEDFAISVALIETCPRGAQGSMARYADLVERALHANGAGGQVLVTRLNLALSQAVLRRLPGRLRSWVHHAAIWLRAPGLLSRLKPDVWHVVDGSHGYVTRWLPRGPVVVTAHDLIPLLQSLGRFPVRRQGRAARWLVRRSVRGLGAADRIVADSRSTRDDLVGVAGVPPEKVCVVPPALSPEMAGATAGAPPPWRERRNRPDAFILHVGNDAFFKNREGVVRIFARVVAECDIRLKMASAPPSKPLLATVRRLGLGGRVEFVAHPDDVRLVELYRSACLFLFPSLYEGFGWPPLEAMANGCPVVASSAGSLPEVLGDAARTASPEDEAALAGHCLDVLRRADQAEDLARRGFRRAQTFTLERMGRNLLEVYREALRVSPYGQSAE